MYFSWYELNKIDMEESVGIDEVGRGPLAGPVVSAAVWISKNFAHLLSDLNFTIKDSKKMSKKHRRDAIAFIKTMSEDMIKYSIASASVEEIDSINILNAAMLSMQRARVSLEIKTKYTLIDGNKSPDLNDTIPITIVKGDDKVLAISLASIIAKEYRDDVMFALSEKYTYYGWDTNAGYGTSQHINAIREFGITEYHRKTFAPINDFVVRSNQ